MFVLVSMPPKMDPLARANVLDMLKPNMDECVVGVYASRELAVQAISTYAGAPHGGKAALIYEMVPDGDKQKRVKIYEGSFPSFCIKLTPPKEPSISYMSGLTKILNARVQKLEEKLEAKEAECNGLKNGPKITDMNARLQKLEEKLEAKCAECNLLKADNREMATLIGRMKKLIQV